MQMLINADIYKEQDKSSDIEEQPPFGDRKLSNILPQMRVSVKNQRHYLIILTKNEAMYPTDSGTVKKIHKNYVIKTSKRKPAGDTNQ